MFDTALAVSVPGVSSKLSRHFRPENRGKLVVQVLVLSSRRPGQDKNHGPRVGTRVGREAGADAAGFWNLQ
ncbi:protein of unknown function [Bradyrhizobium vignae]|uniref:Uncharacterized protein n=1 Tax=Bradyrhizobium vignae TaxID=1549949 RepID=A0A2U3PQ26_9BRAD|nr:protein of unknown function [Bradyrhizobium vignae]